LYAKKTTLEKYENEVNKREWKRIRGLKEKDNLAKTGGSTLG